MKPEPNVVLSPEDFLTGKDFLQTPTQDPTTFTQGVPPMVPGSEIPELHKEPQTVSAAKRNEMDQIAEDLLKKEELAKERAEAEVNTIKHKYTNVPQHPRDILKDLLMTGELRKTFRVFGHDWTLRALDQGDVLLAIDDLKDTIQTDMGKFVSISFSKVVYAIEEIDGTPIYRFFPDIQPNQFSSKIEYIIAIKRALRAYLIAMPPIVIDTLFGKYQEVEQERDQALEKLKNS